MSMLLLLRRRSLRWRSLVARTSSYSSASSPPSSTPPVRRSQALRSLPGARELLQTLERAPCLSCGVAPPAAGCRVDCRVAGLPLACSEASSTFARRSAPACAERLESDRGELLVQFRSIVEDLAFAASPGARRLFSDVLAPSRRLAGGGIVFDSQAGDAAKTTAWTDYLRLYAPPAGSAAAEDGWLLSDERAMRLASSAFSYVLTLSAFLPRLVPRIGTAEASGGDNERAVALHVVGARAEAMMPDYLWDEVALLHARRALEITLVGDHVPISRKVRSARGLPLQIESVRGLYHDVALPSPDALVLFNPGIGHPLLRDRWRPTVRTMIESGKPLLLTAFSAADQDRDVAVLHQLAMGSASDRRLRFLVEPRVNPFRSLKFQVNDDGGNVALIQTNSHVMAVQLAD